MLKNITTTKENYLMPITKIKRNYQITLPRSVREQLKLAVGDYIEIERQQGQIVIKPVKIVHPEEYYFYTKEWQKKEQEADQDIAAGRVSQTYDDVNDFIKDLDR
jgi:antitoxin MazE